MKEIRVERAKADMTQLELAEKLGVSVNTIKRWESGEADPRGSQILAMTSLFGCSADHLLGIGE